MEQTYHVYILASGRNGTLYTGVTGDLPQRVGQHRNGAGSNLLRDMASTDLCMQKPLLM